MNAATLPGADRPSLDSLRVADGARRDIGSPALGSGICWGAILAGAAGAASLSLILLILGVGLGLSSVSPWSTEGLSAGTFGVSTVLWLTFTQLAASALGGYLAGRLRNRWADVQADEVYFRDTAHGFIAWSMATLVTAAVLGGTIASILGAGAKTGAAVAGPAGAAAVAAALPAPADATGAGAGYFVDSLFRRPAAATAEPATASPASSPSAEAGAVTPATGGTSATPGPSAEALRIFANAASTGSLAADDARYLGQQVAQQTGLSPAEAEKRVTDTFHRMQAKAEAAKAQAKAAADQARKATATASLWVFVSLLVGAFVASYAATFGGRHRDLP